ncbi:hypothetical protein CsSME_00030987 [Camellia sinensis var. sinensis]
MATFRASSSTSSSSISSSVAEEKSSELLSTCQRFRIVLSLFPTSQLEIWWSN